jgi:hypothetical protein
MSTKEFQDLVHHPNTTKADAMYAFKDGVPLDFNPYDTDNPKHKYWCEGMELAKQDAFCWQARERKLKLNGL